MIKSLCNPQMIFFINASFIISGIILLTFLTFWIISEFKWSKKVRMPLGLSTFSILVFCSIYLTNDIRRTYDRWKYTGAVKLISNEIIISLKNKDKTLIERLRVLNNEIPSICSSGNDGLLGVALEFNKQNELTQDSIVVDFLKDAFSDSTWNEIVSEVLYKSKDRKE